MDLTYDQVETCLKRLSVVSAEMTEPDIKNILISIFFSSCTSEGVMLNDVIANGMDDLNRNLMGIESTYEIYGISNKRTGWWSKLFKEKWAI